MSFRSPRSVGNLLAVVAATAVTPACLYGFYDEPTIALLVTRTGDAQLNIKVCEVDGAPCSAPKEAFPAEADLGTESRVHLFVTADLPAVRLKLRDGFGAGGCVDITLGGRTLERPVSIHSDLNTPPVWCPPGSTRVTCESLDTTCPFE